MVKDPSKRLGSSFADAEDIKRQPFFRDIDFNLLIKKEIPAPFIPNVKCSRDTSNFDDEFTNELPQFTPVKYHLRDIDKEEFKGFSYIANGLIDDI